MTGSRFMWFALLLSASPVAAARERGTVDDTSFHALAARVPKAAELLEQGELALDQGRHADAEVALRDAAAIAPNSAIVARRYCEALTFQGKQAEAINACNRAMSYAASPADMRAMVGALLRAGERPNIAQFAEAIMTIYALQRFGDNEPNLHAAECDLAAVRHDWAGFARSLARLQQLDPDGIDTKRARALQAVKKPSGLVSLGWLTIALFVLGTLVHALHTAVTSLRRRARVQTAPTIGLLCLTVGLMAKPASAETMVTPPQGMSSFEINHADPESSVPNEAARNARPLEFGYLLMDLTERGDLATKIQDYPTAVRYYRALAKAVPDTAAGFGKLCHVYELTKEHERAIPFCRAAMALSGVRLDDYLRFTRLMLSKSDQLSPEELNELDAVAAHLREQLPDGVAAASVECDVGLKLSDPSRMKRCTEQLAKAAPSAPQTISYRWAYALMRHDYAEASRQLRFAQVSGMNPDAVAAMQEQTNRALPLWRRVFYEKWWLLVSLAALTCAYALLLTLRARRRSHPSSQSMSVAANVTTVHG